MYTYCPETDEVLAYVCGSRSAKTVRELLKKLKDVEIGEYCTDLMKAFTKVHASEKYKIGKAYT